MILVPAAASDPTIVLDPATSVHYEPCKEQVLAEFRPGLRTVVVLLPWTAPPDRYQRIDAAVQSFACSPSVYQDLLAIDPGCRPQQLCFSLLDSILNGNIIVDRIVVRQLPYPEMPAPASAAKPAASVIMAHRGRIAHLRTSLYYLSRANGLDIRVRVGLDGESRADYEPLAESFPRAEFYSLQPQPLGPYVIRQELATRSIEPLLAFHDSDDISCADRFSLLHAEMLRTACDMVGCHELRVDEIEGEVRAIRFPLDATEGLRRCYGHALLHPTSMVTRDGFEAAGGFSTNFAISCDTQFLLRFYFKLPIRNVDGFAYIRRRHPTALTVAPNTNMDAPVRVYLTNCWERNFEAVKRREIPLAQSALRQMRTKAKYQLLPLSEVANGRHTLASWDPEEQAQAAKVRREIDACMLPRYRKAPEKHIVLRLSDSDPWHEGLQEVGRVVLVRQLFSALGFDEYRPFQWRLEHKLVQSLVLDAYLPGVLPVTRGLGRLLCEHERDALPDALTAMFPTGHYIKRALSDQSGDKGLAEALAREALQNCPALSSASLSGEEWIVQEKIPIAVEFRVHTLQDRIIEDLTFRRYVRGDIGAERDAPNRFMQSLLDRLPPGIISGTLCGWDIARTPDGEFRVIEVNFAGFHPVYRPGFQVSGYFVNLDWGAKSTAQLIRFIEKSQRIRIDVVSDVDAESKERVFYEDVIRWKTRLSQTGPSRSADPAPPASTIASQYSSKGSGASTAPHRTPDH